MATVSKQQTHTSSLYLTELCDALAPGGARRLTNFLINGLTIEALAGKNSVWFVIRRSGQRGLALRAAFVLGNFKVKVSKRSKSGAQIRVESSSGIYVISLCIDVLDLERLRVITKFRPNADFNIPFHPRDLYPLDANDNPRTAEGSVEAAQRGFNCGVVYLHLKEPAFGNILYFQNLTALNPYFAMTGTKPDGAVGGEWPELGYLMPTPTLASQSQKPLKAGQEIVLSDAMLVFSNRGGKTEAESALQFLQMLGSVYKALDLPETQYRNWIGRSEATLRDLERAPEATVQHYGSLYVRPYTAAEYPDIMVQMSVLASIHSWGQWSGKPHRLEGRLRKGVERFYDPQLKSLRRYLPNVGKDKDADAVDSWYLYHPLLNLGRLARSGDPQSGELLRKSIDFAIRAAHHFKYQWPIQFKITDFSVITEAANDGRGQTDVGGLYAYVMLLAHELTSEQRFLDEARAAIEVGIGLRFNLNYQANLTAWGAAACVRLWRITNEKGYLDQSYVFLASFFHNTEIWESEIANARHFHNFLAVTCLQDAPYMAIYECFDSYAALENYLADSGPDLEPAVRMLVSEYCKYALDRAWGYYPDALPKEALADKQRNGYIDSALSFPLEDLYADGQPAGQVGQEIYGCGAAFIFATRSHMNVDNAPFRVFCDHFIRSSERTGDTALSIMLDGGETCFAKISFLRRGRGKLPKFTLKTAGGDVLRPRAKSAGRIDYQVPAYGKLVVRWAPGVA
jgi:hypothetical protein